METAKKSLGSGALTGWEYTIGCFWTRNHVGQCWTDACMAYMVFWE